MCKMHIYDVKCFGHKNEAGICRLHENKVNACNREISNLFITAYFQENQLKSN